MFKLLGYKQSTSIKRWRKRDSAVIRKGVEGMDPYCIIREESEDLSWYEYVKNLGQRMGIPTKLKSLRLKNTPP